MSWIKDFAVFTKRLLFLEKQVDSNVSDIKAPRKEINELRMLMQELAYIVRRNQDQTESK